MCFLIIVQIWENPRKGVFGINSASLKGFRGFITLCFEMQFMKIRSDGLWLSANFKRSFRSVNSVNLEKPQEKCLGNEF